MNLYLFKYLAILINLKITLFIDDFNCKVIIICTWIFFINIIFDFLSISDILLAIIK